MDNSALIKRIKNIDETELISLSEPGRPINIDKINERLKQRGYRVQIPSRVMSQDLTSAKVSSPGKILSRELEARGWTRQDLAAIMERPAQAIDEIIQGEKQITPETALELADALDTTPDFWMNLEAKYRLHLEQEFEAAASYVLNKNAELHQRLA